MFNYKRPSKQITKTCLSIFSVLLIVFTLFLSTAQVNAIGKDPKETQTLSVDVGIDRTIDIPLTMESDKTQFYLCGNFGPGDTLKGSVIFNNTCSEPVQISLNNVIKNTPTNTLLLDYITVDISVNNEPVYKDTLKSLVDLAGSLHLSNPDATLTTWIDVAPYRSITMDIECYVSKFDVDNAFQDSIVDTQWVFNSRADVPDDPDEPEEEEPEPEPDVPYYDDPDISEEDTDVPNEDTPVVTGQKIGFISILSIICMTSIFVAVFFTRKNKQ